MKNLFNGPEHCRHCGQVMAFDRTLVWPSHPEDTTLYMICPECKFIRIHGIETKNLQGWKNRLRQPVLVEAANHIETQEKSALR